jgi:hypothetical protein
VRFRAGLELSVMHLGLWAMSLPVRLGMVRTLVPLARPLRWAADWLKPFGTDRGGMRVRVVGMTAEGRTECRDWVLEAEAGDGPEVPAIPARVMVAALRAGQVAPGARACLEMDLAAAEAVMAGHVIRTRQEAVEFPLLFNVVDMAALPRALQDLHLVVDLRRWSGKAVVDRGTSVLSRLAGRLMRFPPAGQDVAVTVTMERKDTAEQWTRVFGSQTFRSRLSPLRHGQGLVERFGALSFQIALRVEDGRLRYPVARGWCLGVPIPRPLLPVSKTVEAVDDQGRATFDVELSHPITGLIVRYRGYLIAS